MARFCAAGVGGGGGRVRGALATLYVGVPYLMSAATVSHAMCQLVLLGVGCPLPAETGSSPTFFSGTEKVKCKNARLSH